MKYLNSITTMMFLFFLSSCSTGGNHPDFEANVETVMTLFELQASESDPQAQLDLMHEDLEWQPPFFGSEPISKSQYADYSKSWQDTMEDVVYTATNYLPGVNSETGILDGSVRSYGTWTGVHSETGKSWELSSYHTFDFKDGLVVSGGDYFDAGGFIASLAPSEEE